MTVYWIIVGRVYSFRSQPPLAVFTMRLQTPILVGKVYPLFPQLVRTWKSRIRILLTVGFAAVHDQVSTRKVYPWVKKNESTVIQSSLGSISAMSPRKIPGSDPWNFGTGWPNLSPGPGWTRSWALGFRDQFKPSRPQTFWSSVSEASSSSSEPSTMSSW